jgi:serine/threonine protein kinase
MITHKDLKSGNIMFSKSGDAKIIDFGCSQTTTYRNYKMKKIVGSPQYVAPEVLSECYG